MRERLIKAMQNEAKCGERRARGEICIHMNVCVFYMYGNKEKENNSCFQ